MAAYAGLPAVLVWDTAKVWEECPDLQGYVRREREETVVEHADVVVVGARLAGCAVAAPLARAGRKVVVLDKMSFPSDQLSTHVLMPGRHQRAREARARCRGFWR